MFDHKTLSMPDEFMSPIFTHDNDVFKQGHYESSNEQYKPETDHDSQHATTMVQNMLFDTDNIELPASMMKLLDDFQNLPTPQSFSNLFQDAFPTSYSEDMTTDTTMVADVMTVNNTSYTTDTPYGTQLTIVMLPFQISTLINSHPYPPTNMVGPVTEHDRPYSKYGHLNQNILRCKFRFDVSGVQTLRKRRANKCRSARKMYAIICHTNISKENIIMEIYRHFPLPIIHYICVSVENPQIITTTTTTTTANLLSTFYIQIILKKIINKKIWFLDKVTGEQCNYDVTKNDMAWNEYIKKNGDFIEIGDFKSITVRSRLGVWASSEFVRAQKKKKQN
ncbi:unnamed protein product [Rotaria sp. Silwood1]|nr:unnamed protein product [Rotaria sp. Silwood1]